MKALSVTKRSIAAVLSVGIITMSAGNALAVSAQKPKAGKSGTYKSISVMIDGSLVKGKAGYAWFWLKEPAGLCGTK